MEENKNSNQQPEQKQEGSVFLTQIQSKTAENQAKQPVHSSIFQTFNASSDEVTSSIPSGNHKSFPLTGILGGLAFLFLLFIVLMVVVIVFGGNNNSLLVAFNIDETQLKSFLLYVVNGSFGLVAFTSLILFVISLFRMSLVKKEEKEKRNKLLRHVLISFIFLFLVLSLWFGTWRVVAKINLDIPINELRIITTPSDLNALTAPVDISFEAKAIVESLYKRGMQPEKIGWDFNGDSVSEVYSDTETSIQHHFDRDGSFTVSLVVFFANNQTQKFSVNVNIASAEFSANKTQGFIPLEIEFNATSLERFDARSISFEWDFDGDGVYDSKSNKPNIRYTFTKAGVYNVGLRIIDVNNNFRTYSKKIQALRDDTQQIEAKINASPVSGTAPLRVEFSGTESFSSYGEISAYEWDLGATKYRQYGRRVSYVYDKPGEYTVTLSITDDKKNKAQAQKTIKVTPTAYAPVAKINTIPALVKGEAAINGVVPFSVKFDGSGSKDQDNNIVEYAWDFNGDKEFDDFNQEVEHTFLDEGEFTVVLKVTDKDEQISQAEIKINTRPRDLQAVLEASPVSGALPLKVDFDASTSVYKKGKIVSYEWNFGDGSGKEYADAQKTHIYDKEGQYTVSVRIHTEDGLTAETTKKIFVSALQLQSCFSATPIKGKAPLSVEFDASCSKGDVAKWNWDFNDGSISNSHSPAHTFNQVGEYDVVLEVIDAKNNSSSFKSKISVISP